MSFMRGWTRVVVLVLVAVIALAAVYEIYQFQLTTQVAPIGKTLFQVSTYATMAAGDYYGKITYGELAKHGDFGIGAFESMNGEMIALDGNFYQITTINGVPQTVETTQTTPFAMVTYFETDQTLYVQEAMNYTELKAFIDSNLPTLDGIYAIKIHGTFETAKTRSVPIQTPPYPALLEVVANQTVFNLTNVEGTIAGYRCPTYMDGINVAGYHCHFITDDKTAGGHMLDLVTQNITIEIDHIQQYQTQNLP